MTEIISQVQPEVPAAPATDRVRWFHLLILLGLLALGGGLRLVHLTSESLWLDEYWSEFLSTGRGQFSDSPLGQPNAVALDPAPAVGFDDAPHWWRIWTGMSSAVHPPLYHIVLRWWIDLFGDGDISVRLFSSFCDLVAAIVLFDAVRRLHGPWPGIIAAGFMIFSVLQIDYSQQVRSYTMLAMLSAIVCDLAVIILQKGSSPARMIALGAAAAAMALTHYFAAGALFGLGAFACLCLRGQRRSGIVLSLAAALFVVVLAWGPFFWRSRGQLIEQGEFLFGQRTGIASIPMMALAAPGRMILAANGIPSWPALAALAVLVLIVPPLCRKHDHAAMFFWFVAVGGILFVTLIDLVRHTSMIYYTRYVFEISPAVYALLACVFPRRLRMNQWAPSLLLLCAMVFGIDRTLRGAESVLDWKNYCAKVDHQLAPRDLIAFTKATEFHPQFCYIVYRHYVPHSQRPVMFLENDSPGAAELSRLAGNYHVWLLSSNLKDDMPRYFPGWSGGRYISSSPGLAMMELFPPGAALVTPK